MLKSWVQISVRGSNPLFKAPSASVNLSWMKRLKSSNAQPVVDFEHPVHSRYSDIFKSKSFLDQKEKKQSEIDYDSEPIIKCKRPEFNHYRNQKYKDFEAVPLATKGWRHRKSKGDHFSILIHSKDYKREFSKEETSFSETGLDQTIVEILNRNGIKVPTQIQRKAIPPILHGHNALIAAETGCGKTVAYLAPIIQHIIQHKSSFSGKQDDNSPFGLIITPGRDLAEQIHEVAKWFCNELDLECRVVTGGRGKKQMMNAEFYPVDLLISSLGALSKFTTNGIYSLRHVRHVVLDEADCLLDDSFNSKLLQFLSPIQFASNQFGNSAGAQLVLASATMPTSLADLLQRTIDVDKLERITTSNLHFLMPHVKQTFYRVGKSEKTSYLLQFAKEAAKKKLPTIIFSNKAASSDFISIFLNENNIKCLNLNGDMNSELKRGRFKKFQEGEFDFLSTTDVCSRGLDTTRVKRIINYDFPPFISDYIHRSGRTGRVGSPKDCEVFNFVSDNYFEVKLVQQIELATRMMASFHNVNANIARILFHRAEKKSKVIYEITDQGPTF